MLNNAKVEQIIHIPTMCGPDFSHWSSNALAAFDYNADEVWKALDHDNILDDEELAEWLTENRKGFLVEVDTPLPKYINDNIFAHSWDSIVTRWFYVEDFCNLSSLVLRWQNELIESQRPKI